MILPWVFMFSIHFHFSFVFVKEQLWPTLRHAAEWRVLRISIKLLQVSSSSRFLIAKVELSENENPPSITPLQKLQPLRQLLTGVASALIG